MKRLIIIMALFVAMIAPVQADDYKTYRVTITNATNLHVLTPPLLVTHNKNFKLFSVSEAASPGLVVQAETGSPADIYAEVSGAPGVQDVVAASVPIVYGNSATFEISATKKAMLSFSAMLATTNDAFAALNSVALPKKKATYFAYTYDAGSEMNNEDCDFIPGPPCGGASNLRTATGEGFIAIHNGVQGGSDLNPKNLDWRGPTAIITVERISHDN